MSPENRLARIAQARIAENWSAVLADVAQAVATARRQPDDVRVIGVTKYVDAQTASPLAMAGCCDFGENRPQSLWDKAESGLFGDAQWHVIGHLQRNKVKRSLRHRPIIHSVDSERLLKTVAQESRDASLTTKVLLEVNISGDESKTGLPEAALGQLLQQLADDASSESLKGVEVVGLMAMAGWGTDAVEAQKQFAQVRELRNVLASRFGIPLRELSMGMSGDFQAAIAEGATMIRIGSRLFAGIID